jgi:hypothetical protein
LGEVKDSDVRITSVLVLLRPRPLRHDFVIFEAVAEGWTGADLGLDVAS